jgi:uncharacterized protein (DUF427 family)
VVKAVWNDIVLADSDDTIVVERNHYFPAESLAAKVLKPSATTTVCPWKGVAHYYSIVAGDLENPDAAWYYPDPKPAAAEIKGRVAFWKGVNVSYPQSRWARAGSPRMTEIVQIKDRADERFPVRCFRHVGQDCETLHGRRPG